MRRNAGSKRNRNGSLLKIKIFVDYFYSKVGNGAGTSEERGGKMTPKFSDRQFFRFWHSIAILKKDWAKIDFFSIGVNRFFHGVKSIFLDRKPSSK